VLHRKDLTPLPMRACYNFEAEYVGGIDIAISVKHIINPYHELTNKDWNTQNWIGWFWSLC